MECQSHNLTTKAMVILFIILLKFIIRVSQYKKRIFWTGGAIVKQISAIKLYPLILKVFIFCVLGLQDRNWIKKYITGFYIMSSRLPEVLVKKEPFWKVTDDAPRIPVCWGRLGHNGHKIFISISKFNTTWLLLSTT